MSGTKISKNKKILKSNTYGYIYIIKNKVNGKVYIGKVGSPRTPNDIWIWHCKQASKVKEARELFPNETVYGTHLQNSIIKYGKKSFEWNYLDKAKNLEELNEKEKHWIKKYDSMNREKGYNLIT